MDNIRKFQHFGAESYWSGYLFNGLNMEDIFYLDKSSAQSGYICVVNGQVW